MKNIIIAVFVLFLTVGCKSQKTSTTSTDRQERQQQTDRPERGERGERSGPPSTAEIFKMDTNNDGKLSKAEVKGPIQRDFSKIDSNGDGFITKTELENAPRPQRGQRPPKN